jgi:hypothetical protein
VDLKVNVYALALSLLTTPFLILLMRTLRRSQFEEHFSQPFHQTTTSVVTSVANVPNPTTTQNLSDPDTLVAVLGANRLVWALWALTLRLTSTMIPAAGENGQK